MESQRASDGMRDRRPSRFWWALIVCLMLVGAGGASAALAAVGNSDPIAKDNGYRVKSGNVLERSAPAVLRNDTDPDGDRIFAVRASAPKHGNLVLRRNGSFTYTPNKHFHGIDTFKYTARDGKGGQDTASVKIIVWPIIAPPLARPNFYQVPEDGTLSRQAPGVLMNDIEADGMMLFATKVTDPEHGTLNLNPDGSFEYTPDQDFNGEDSFVYRAEDRKGRGDNGTVTISVGAVNDAPSFTKGADQTVDEDAGAQSVSPWGTGISAGPADESGQNLTFEVTQNSNPGLFAAGPAISQNGALTYTPADNENGSATIKVRLKDDGGTANGGADTSGEQEFGITVNSIDDGPSVSVANNGPIDEGGSATITASATDVDSPGSTFSYEFDCDDDSTFEVGPQPGNTTDCSFDDDGDRVVNVRVTDGTGGEANGSTTVTVNNVAPTATGQSVTTDEDAAKTITLAGTDPAGSADPLSYKITSLPADGTLYEGNSTNAADEIQPSDLPQSLPSNQVTYKPDENFSGPNAFEFKANDGAVDSAAETVSIQVDAVNDAPTVETESGTASYTEGGQAVEVSPLLTVSDVDSTDLVGATVSITTGLRSGDTLSFDTQNGITGNYNGGTGVLTLNGTSSVGNYQTALRSVRYSSTSNSPGASRTISFQVSDGGAANNLSNTATRGVSITETN
ncbi:MAG TPA: Ig-like domain-containing protein, partial [Rubrobacter sp.]